MKMLNKRATAIFNKLAEGLRDMGDCRVIGEAGGAFMPVHIEKTGEFSGRPIFSIAHYFEQNGDLCCDPDCTFWVTDSGIVPMSFEQGIPPIYQVSVQLKDGAVHCHEALQADHCSFANDWMMSIAEQQNLD